MVAVTFGLARALHYNADLDEFKVKREAVFEFAQKPQVTRQGDRVTIAFETKGLEAWMPRALTA
jgi:hypothetical protein